MAFNYDALYAKEKDALGPPTPEVVSFFAKLGKPSLTVLDIGCGQGRDALFIARMGHRVTGVDLSPHGIRDMVAAAAREGLPVKGITADIRAFEPDEPCDVLVIDRTLHMLPRSDRLDVLRRLINTVAPEGWALIADEPSNMGEFEAVFAEHSADWSATSPRPGLMIQHRV